MSRTALPFLCACVALLIASATPAAAHDPGTSGGAAMPDRPELVGAECADGTTTCIKGEYLKIKGEYLDTARTVVFLGRSGRRDNRKVAATSHTPHRVMVRVPRAARSGPLKVVSPVAGASSVGPRVKVKRAPAAPVAAVDGTEGVFPVQGRYDMGTEVNRFGGGRGHMGHDVFAACGTPLVAALSGKVTIAKWQDRAGNYVVIKADDGTSQAYMHLQRAASVSKGERVTAGQRIGRVGDTGRASGCHLHFELWTAPGWYEGGEAIDPLPSLRRWAQASA